MPVMILPKEDGTDFRKRVELMSCREMYDINDIKNTLNMSILEAFDLATAYTNLKGIRYRVLKSTPASHTLVGEIVKILNKGFSKHKLPLYAKEMTTPEAKKRNANRKTSFLIVAISHRFKHYNSEPKDCYGITDAEALVQLETTECEVPKVMKNSPTTGLMITGVSFFSDSHLVRDFVNPVEFAKHHLVESAFRAIKNTHNNGDSEYFNCVCGVDSLGRECDGSERFEKAVQTFRRLITISEEFIKEMGMTEKV